MQTVTLEAPLLPMNAEPEEAHAEDPPMINTMKSRESYCFLTHESIGLKFRRVLLMQ